MDVDYTIEALLDLNGTALYQEEGYWVFIEARVIDANARVPHGIKYSLTLHDLSGKRVLGMDNAHRIRKATAYGKTPEQSDHIHKADAYMKETH